MLALSRLRRSLIFAIWLDADLFATSRLALRLVISLVRRATDCCIALFSSTAATSMAGGFEKPPLAAAPTIAPKPPAIPPDAASTAYRLCCGRRMKRRRFGAAMYAMLADPCAPIVVASFETLSALVDSIGVASPAEFVVPIMSAGEIDGDSTAGNSILGCGCPDALSGCATPSPSVAALRLSMVLLPWIGRSPIGNHDGLPIGYQS